MRFFYGGSQSEVKEEDCLILNVLCLKNLIKTEAGDRMIVYSCYNVYQEHIWLNYVSFCNKFTLAISGNNCIVYI